ncbi:hypothetical protein RQP46_002324 [Phenoliferia psychrophenolica]
MFNFIATLLACVRQPSATSVLEQRRETTSTSTSLVKRAWTWVSTPLSAPVVAKSPRSSSPPTSLRPISLRALPPFASNLTTLSVESIHLAEIEALPPMRRFGPYRSATRTQLLRALRIDATAQLYPPVTLRTCLKSLCEWRPSFEFDWEPSEPSSSPEVTYTDFAYLF